MKIIKIFSDYATTEDMIRAYFNMDNLFFDKNYNVTYRFTDDEDYTHAIIINNAMPELKISKENVIGLAHEPPEFLNLSSEFINYVNKYVSKYYIGEKYTLPDEFIEGYGYIGHCSIPKCMIHKNKLMSIMISQKQFTHGHIYRHKLAELILHHNLPIDIYGRGCNLYSPNNLLKGEFNNNECIENYLFHISIENTQHPHYFTEKITNSLLYGTNVLYLGCNNIFNYFDEDDGIYLLNGDLSNDINLIINILNNWQKYYKEINREKILNKINITNLIENL